MADISTQIAAINNAVYGKDVRNAISTALTAMNGQAAAAQVWATGSDSGTDTPSATNNAKYYSEQAAASAATLQLDTTLSTSGKAADAAAVGDAVSSTVPFNLAAGATLTDGKYVRWSTGGVNDYEYYSATDEIDISGCSKIIYTRQVDVFASENPVFGMAFYDSSHTYISGIPSKRVTTAATTEWYEADVPSGAKYARFTYWLAANQVIPFTVYDAAQYHRSKLAKEIDDLKKSVDDSTGLTFSQWKNSACILSTYYDSQYASNNGLMQGVQSSASSSLKASDFIPVYGKMLELPIPIVADTTWPNYGMSLYDANFNPILGRAVSCIPNRSGNTYVAWIHVYLPKEAKYFRTTYWTDSSAAITGGYAPAFTYNLLAEIPDCWKPITHELPVDTYMQNAIRRARQITDIKWTPRVNIPRYCMLNGGSVHFLDWFYEDKEYLGIPYSGALGQDRSSDWTTPKEWGYAHMWVGQCVPFEAFVTAARFPNSIFSETVDRTSVNYSASPFGIVCTALVNYAVDGPLPLRVIPNFFDTADTAFRKPSSSNTVAALAANDYEIGDFLYTSAHVIIITDLLRDSSGNVTHIEMSEATTVGNGNNAVKGTQFGGVARRKMWEFNEFKSKYADYVKYRKTSFYGVPYTPSKFVDTGNEGPGPNVIDYACIPYLGNNAVYRVGYIVNTKILIGATGWTKLVVQKDGAAFGTFDVTGLTEVSVGFSAAGEYEAWLTNAAETSRTMSCTWSVVSGTA